MIRSGALRQAQEYEVTDTSGSQRRLYYDGHDLVLEYAGSGAPLRRFVHGPSAGDDALLWYEGSTVSNATRRHLHADRLGSIVAVTDYQGALFALPLRCLRAPSSPPTPGTSSACPIRTIWAGFSGSPLGAIFATYVYQL